MSHVHRTPRTQQITSHENLMNWENPRPKPNLRGAIGLPKPTHLHPLENELSHLNPPLKKKTKTWILPHDSRLGFLDVNRILRFRGLLQFPPPHSPKGLLQRHHAAVHFQVRLVPWSWRFAVWEPENHHDFMGESSENHLYMKHYHPFYRANS